MSRWTGPHWQRPQEADEQTAYCSDGQCGKPIVWRKAPCAACGGHGAAIWSVRSAAAEKPSRIRSILKAAAISAPAQPHNAFEGRSDMDATQVSTEALEQMRDTAADALSLQLSQLEIARHEYIELLHEYNCCNEALRRRKRGLPQYAKIEAVQL